MTTNVKPDSKEFTAEKTVWQLFKAAMRIKGTDENVAVSLIVSIVLSGYSVLSSTHSLSEQLRALAVDGLNYGAAVLGFLIAGFAVLATLGTSKLVMFMASKRSEKTGYPYIKEHYLNIVYVFFAYWVFVLVCLAIKIFGPADGLASIIARGHGFWISEVGAFAAAQLGYILFATGFTYVVLLLGTLIYNVHMTMMSMIRLEYDKDEQEEIAETDTSDR